MLNKKDFKLGSRDMNGSKEVVELVGSTPTAIGYSGMGYATPAVKMLKVKKAAADPAYEPNVANTLAKTYPIARSLQVYTLGEPQGAVKKYIDWMLSDAGQKVVEASGYVPLPAEARSKPSQPPKGKPVGSLAFPESSPKPKPNIRSRKSAFVGTMSTPHNIHPG